jgi:hypothetical protein
MLAEDLLRLAARGSPETSTIPDLATATRAASQEVKRHD